MGATLAVLVDRVQNNYGEQSTNYVEDPEIKQWIQEAHNKLAETGYLEATVTASLVDHQPEYAISGWIGTSSDRQIWQFRDVQYRQEDGTRWYQLRSKPWNWMRRTLDGTQVCDGTTGAVESYSGEGNPAYYCYHGQYLYLSPVPSYDQDVSLKLVFAAIELIDDDTDTTSLPPKGEDAVVAHCLAQWYAKDRNLQARNHYMGEFTRLWREVRGWYESNRSDTPEMIQPSEARGIRFS